MRAFKDITGQRFNRLVALEPTSIRDHTSIVWKFQCDCGNIHFSRPYSVTTGKIKSCGCYKSELIENSFKDVTGQRFGRLVAVKYLDKNKGYALWSCHCDCGNETIVRIYDLLRGNTRSCGCLARDVHTLPSGEASFRRLLKDYKLGAKTRNISFELTDEQFRDLTSQSCYYCEVDPFRESGRGDKKFINGFYVHNGIDRIDNSVGYVFENCVPCCKVCNQAKNNMSLPEFLEWIERVHSHMIRE